MDGSLSWRWWAWSPHTLVRACWRGGLCRITFLEGHFPPRHHRPPARLNTLAVFIALASGPGCGTEGWLCVAYHGGRHSQGASAAGQLAAAAAGLNGFHPGVRTGGTFGSGPIQLCAKEAGLLRRFASLAMTVNMNPRSRGAFRPRFASCSRPQKSEGAGKTGGALQPRPGANAQECAQSYRSAESIRDFPAHGFTDYNVISPVSRLCCQPRMRIASTRFSHRAPDHIDFADARAAGVSRNFASTHPRPRP